MMLAPLFLCAFTAGTFSLSVTMLQIFMRQRLTCTRDRYSIQYVEPPLLRLDARWIPAKGPLNPRVPQEYRKVLSARLTR